MTLNVPALCKRRIEHCSGGLQAYSWPGDRRALLVHGWDASSLDFSVLVPLLARAGWGGFAYDAPAHGRSDGRTTDFLALGRVFNQVIADEGPFEAVICHSFGSVVALHNLAETGALPGAAIVSGGAPTSLKNAFEIFTEPLQLAPRVWAHLDRRITARLGRPSSEFSITRVLRRMEGDVLLIHDHQDGMVPFEAARRLHQAARRADLVQTNGVGHRGWLKHEPTLERVVGFLNS